MMALAILLLIIYCLFTIGFMYGFMVNGVPEKMTFKDKLVFIGFLICSPILVMLFLGAVVGKDLWIDG